MESLHLQQKTEFSLDCREANGKDCTWRNENLLSFTEGQIHPQPHGWIEKKGLVKMEQKVTMDCSGQKETSMLHPYSEGWGGGERRQVPEVVDDCAEIEFSQHSRVDAHRNTEWLLQPAQDSC